MATRITLIRHGETSWNASGRWQGHAPIPLTEEGRRQAPRLAQHLSQIAGEITAVYSSDLARAYETAEIIVKDLKLTIPLVADVRLRETDIGDWQGMTKEDIELWDYQRWQEVVHDHTKPRPGGESPIQVAERATAAIHDYVEKHAGGHLLVVSHGGTIRNILHRLDLINIDVSSISNTSVTVLVHDHTRESHWILHALNQMLHLRPDETVKPSHEG